MDTVQAIIWTQVPIAVAILIIAWQMWRIKQELVEILKQLSKK